MIRSPLLLISLIVTLIASVIFYLGFQIVYEVFSGTQGSGFALGIAFSPMEWLFLLTFLLAVFSLAVILMVRRIRR